jgi:hypothetical protein
MRSSVRPVETSRQKNKARLRLLTSGFGGDPHGLQFARNANTSEGVEVKYEKGVKYENSA